MSSVTHRACGAAGSSCVREPEINPARLGDGATLARKRWMMRIVPMLMIGVAALAFAAPAQAAPDIWQGLYLKGGVGWSIMSGKADFLNVPDADLDYQSNALVSAAVGYKWQGWRAE